MLSTFILKLDQINETCSDWITLVQTWSNWIKMDHIGLNLDFGKFGQKLSQTGSNLINFVQTCFYLGFWQFGQLGLWVTWAMGDLSFGWLELWVTWALGDLSFGWLELWQFGKLGHWTAWVTCTLDNLDDLTNNWEVWCIEKLDSRFSGWKYFRLVLDQILRFFIHKICNS